MNPSVSKSYPLFGASVEMVLYDMDEQFALPLMDDAYALGLRLQSIFNFYDPKSELSTLNRNRTLSVSRELLEVLREALRCCELSKGAYDITKGRQFLQRKKGDALSPVGCSYLDVQIKGTTVTLSHPDILIDLGSIAKGYIGERMAASLVEGGAVAGYVDARGDLRLFGEQMPVSVQHPRSQDGICEISVCDKGVATSGDYKQYIGDYNNSHIVNKNDVISVTVVADDLSTADAYATLLMVCDRSMRERIMRLSDIKAMIIDDQLRIHNYNGFEQLVQL